MICIPALLPMALMLGLLSPQAGVWAEDIRLNDCEIRGADSFGDYNHMFRWPPGDGAPIPFAWGQFEHDGDEFCHVTSNTFSAQIQYWALSNPAYLEIKTYHTDGQERSRIYQLTPSPVPGEDWRTLTEAFFTIKTVENVALPFPAGGAHFRLREHCGRKQVIKEDKTGATVTIGNSDARFRVVSIGFAYGNWAANWQGMDFHPGDAQDNFDNFTLEHDRATDYVEFTTQESGQCTIQAYCRKKPSEPGNMRVKVNGKEKATPSVTSTDFGWVNLWTGELVGGDTIRIENNEWEEDRWWPLSDIMHYSCVEFRHESRWGPAFRVVPVGGGTGNPPPPPPPPPPPDTTPPVLQNITADPVTHDAAIIRFTANEDVQWCVEYGTTEAYGSVTILRDFDVPRVTSLSGLAPTTTYHFRIRATDRANNTTVTSDRTFTTKAAPDRTAPTITNVQATVTHNSATVTWTTNEPANSMVHYGRQGQPTTWTGLPDFVTQHSVTVIGLTPNAQYTYWVRSADPSGNIGESTHLTFATPAPPDTTPPVILIYDVRGITQTSAKIYWRTNESATSVVYYGTTPAYGLEATVEAPGTEHEVPLSRLQPNQTYHYQIRTADAAGNLSTQTGTFTTEPPDEGTISGTVTRPDTGAKVAGATITIKGLADFTTTSKPDGTYLLTAVPIGQRTVRCDAPGYRSKELTVTVYRAQTITRDFTITPVGTVYGYVRVPDTGRRQEPLGQTPTRGINDATVRLLPGARTTQTTRGYLSKPDRPDNGYFAFDDVPLGFCSLEVSAPGYVTQKVTLTLTEPGQKLRKDIILVPVVHDLVTSDADLTVNPTAPVAGQRLTIGCKVTNAGNVETRDVKVRFKWGETLLSHYIISSIPVGASRQATYIWNIPTTEGGRGTISVIVDPDNALTEAHEDNNTASRSMTITPLLPDVSILPPDITHTPASPGVGQTVSVKPTVKNVGTAQAQGLKVILKRGDEVLATTTRSSLGVGEYFQPSLTWTLPPGTYDPFVLTVVVDPDNTVAELDENNNQADHTVTPAKPDLSVVASEITPNPAAPLAGTSVRLSIKVRNLGQSKAQNVLLRVLRDTEVIGQESISTLSADSSATKTVAWTIPAFLSGQVPLQVVVDPEQSVPEGNENNNATTYTLTVTPRQVDLELTAAEITHSPASPQANQTVSITAKIYNRGNVKASDVKIRFLRGAEQIGEKTISSISAGSHATTTLSWKVPAGTTGTLTIQVHADPDNAITETIETNNTATHSIPVGGG